jgi:hypothetical protein
MNGTPRNSFQVGAIAAFVLAAAVPLMAQTPWIHVEVNEGGSDNSHVKVNLPLSLIEVAMDAVPEKVLERGHIRIHSDDDVDVEDLRRMWSELRKTGDSELVSVEKDDQSVSVRREGNLVLVNVEERNGKDQDGKDHKVVVQVPVSVVDALLSGQGQELNLKGAISELKSLRGEIVRVDDGGDKVRIWIDEKD